MAKRGRRPKGEYADKSAVMNFRIRPDTKRLLEEAARKSGRTLSKETEHQLRRALIDMGTGPLHAMLSAVGAAMDPLIRMRSSTPERWSEDPIMFDQVICGITGALELFRPAKRAPRTSDLAASIHRAVARASLVAVLEKALQTDPLVPLAKQSAEQRKLTLLKQELGALFARPGVLKELF
jgi:hypothetical protein